MDWLKGLVTEPSSPQAVENWSRMMSNPSKSEKQLTHQVELITVLRDVSPVCDIKLETDKVTTRWSDEENTVRLYLHFMGTHERYSFVDVIDL